MLKRNIDLFLKHHFKNYRTALLIEGARQIGKTFSIREFGKNFNTFVEINFAETPDAMSLFKNVSGVTDLIARLSLFSKDPLIKGNTLFFFDEVQLCPECLTYIKYLVDEGSYRYVLSGSLLGIELKNIRSVPVGYMSVKRMYPLSIEEFYLNLGVSEQIISSVKDAWDNLQSVDNYIHLKLMELFRLYLVVGGMPAVVNKYIESNNLQEVLYLQKEIINLYKKDISQYDSKNKLSILEIYSFIAPELNNQNKRFIFKDIRNSLRFDRIENRFLWLKDAGAAIPVYNVEEPKIPLLLSKSRNLFKLFMNDIGLLAAEYSQGIQLKIISGDKNINFGSIFENAVAQELLTKDLDIYYYNNKKNGELDFVIELNGKVLPIEVKSGKDYKVHRALSNIMDCKEYSLEKAVVFNNDNLKVDGKLIYAPIYMVMFLRNEDNLPCYKVDLSGLKA